MPRTCRYALVAAILLPVSLAFAQDAPTEKPMGRPKPPSVAIPGDKLELKLGEPLSLRALVTRPTPLKGLVSWSLETRRHRGGFSATALSPDGKLLATGGLDGTVRVWEIDTGKLVRALIGHGSYVYGLAFSPDGNTLASAGSFDSTVRLWDVRSGYPLKVLKGHPTYVVQVAWSPDGKTILAAGGTSGTMSRWDAVTGNYRTKYEFGQSVRSLAWHPDGKTAAVACAMMQVQIWDDATNRIKTMLGDANADFHSVSWSPNGKTLAAGGAKNALLFDNAGGTLDATLPGPAWVVAWLSDGKRVAVSNGSGNESRIWDVAETKVLKTLTGTAYVLHVTPDDKQLVGGNYDAFSVYDIEAAKANHTYQIAGTLPPLWWTGRPLITGVGTSKLSLWDNTTGKLLRSLEGHGTIAAVAWSPDGKTLATASHDKTVVLWDSTSGKATRTFDGHTAPVLTVAYSPDGKTIASGGQDKKVLVWDPSSGKVLQTLNGHVDHVTCLAWAPGASGQLASGGNDKTVRVWNARTGQTGKSFSEEGETQVVSLAWSPDAKTLVSGHYDHRARMWQVASGKLVHALENAGSPPQVSSLAWSPNDTLLASGRANHTLQLWNIKTGAQVHTIPTMAPVQRVSWLADSRTVVCSSADRTTRFFDVASGLVRGVLLAEEQQVIALSFDGHYRADPNALAELICVAQLDKSQETMTPAQFAQKFKWKNVPTSIRLTGK